MDEPENQETSSPVRRRWHRTRVVGTIFLVVAVPIVWAGQLIHIDYYTEAPGEAVPVQPMVTIDGATEYEAEGSFMLLYIRKRERISLLRYAQAWLDPDIDVKKGDYSKPGNSPAVIDAGSTSDMEQAGIAARKLALELLGYEVTPVAGVVVTGVIEGRPAAGVLTVGDVLLEADGKALDSARTLVSIIHSHDVGDELEIKLDRDGETETVTLKMQSSGDPNPVPIIGVFTDVRYEFPVDIKFEGRIEAIGGPSAGLSMTLALLDELTEGELTGGIDVAVTGTIDILGNVGNVGRVDLKAKAAANAGATLMLVPKCREAGTIDDYESPETYELVRDFKKSCDAEVRRARQVIDTVVEVATLDEALNALAAHGGDPLPEQVSPQ